MGIDKISIEDPKDSIDTINNRHPKDSIDTINNRDPKDSIETISSRDPKDSAEVLKDVMDVTRKDILEKIAKATLIFHHSKDKATTIRQQLSGRAKSRQQLSGTARMRKQLSGTGRTHYGSRILGVPREFTGGGSACSNHKTG